MFYSASTLVSKASLAQEVGLALGAQAGEAQCAKVVTSGGCALACDGDATNLVFEARP
jgi:hypothetical protein